MIRRPETLFIGNKIDRPVRTPAGLKMVWHHSTGFERYLAAHRPVVESSREKVVANHIGAVGVNLFEDNTLLRDTLESLTGIKEHPEDVTVEGVLVAAGLKSFILAYRAIIDRNPHYFVAALSPAPVGGRLDKDLKEDFRNLGILYPQVQASDPNIQPVLKSPQPLALGETSFEGVKHSVFTMSYLPYPELNTSILGEVVVLRYTTDPLKPDRDQEATNRSLQRLVESAEGRKVLNNNLRDLMKASCMVYLILDESFPTEAGIANGDWVGNINKKGGLDVAGLTTLRGKLGKLSEREFSKMLRDQRVKDKTQVGRPFEGFSDDEIRATIADLRPKLPQAANPKTSRWMFWR